MNKIEAIPAFKDNYIWLLHNGIDAIVIDPGVSAPVIHRLHALKLKLTAILITHWHPDHTGGIDALTQLADVPVIGPDSEHIPQVTRKVANGERLTLLDETFDVLSVPGHTLDHMAYYGVSSQALFCGDTLFAGGCGRMFEGNAEQFSQSLAKLKALPESTQVFCAHEYTLANLEFALAVEPDNIPLHQRIDDVRNLRRDDQPTVPSLIADELATNPFLRLDKTHVITMALNQGACSDRQNDVFATLREWKNNF